MRSQLNNIIFTEKYDYNYLKLQINPKCVFKMYMMI